MSESLEYKLAQTLMWSDQAYKLDKFLMKFKLPQVVLVKEGFCDNDEQMTFSSHQILTLHQLWVTHKVVCQGEDRKEFLLPANCELLAEVLPLDSNDMNITAKQLTKTRRRIKYVRVLEAIVNGSKDPKNSFKTNDILEIKKIERNFAGIQCRNLSFDHDTYISSNDASTFVPLLDPNHYTLAEIKVKYGFPAKIRFINKRNKFERRSNDSGHSMSNLCRLGEITAINEVNESEVIVTMVCSNVKEKVKSMKLFSC